MNRLALNGYIISLLPNGIYGCPKRHWKLYVKVVTTHLYCGPVYVLSHSIAIHATPETCKNNLHNIILLLHLFASHIRSLSLSHHIQYNIHFVYDEMPHSHIHYIGDTCNMSRYVSCNTIRIGVRRRRRRRVEYYKREQFRAKQGEYIPKLLLDTYPAIGMKKCRNLKFTVHNIHFTKRYILIQYTHSAYVFLFMLVYVRRRVGCHYVICIYSHIIPHKI